MRHHDEATGEHVRSGAEMAGAAVGGLGGAAVGAGVGSSLGPLGTVIGAMAGAVGGWWTAERVVEIAVREFGGEEHDFRRSHAAAGQQDADYESVRPAYQLGYVAGRNPDYRGKTFDEVESHLQSGWTGEIGSRAGDWSKVRPYVNEAFTRGQARTLTVSEEDVAVGKRAVQVGDVTVRKVVETERVVERVPLKREEVIIERRPLHGARAPEGIQIGEQEIRIPIVDEEAVVEKRVVPKEEIVIRKDAVEQTKTVEAEVRRERAAIDDTAVDHGAGRPDDLAGR